jgi:hypothetical protein
MLNRLSRTVVQIETLVSYGATEYGEPEQAWKAGSMPLLTIGCLWGELE